MSVGLHLPGIGLIWLGITATVERFSVNSEFFLSVFSRIWTKYGEILCISLYSARMRENPDQKNSKYGQLYAVIHKITIYAGITATCFLYNATSNNMTRPPYNKITVKLSLNA